MIQNLPRQMLWSDFKTIDRFYKIDPLNSQFHEVLKTIQISPFEEKKDDTNVFNEVYYQMTRMSYERAMPSDLKRYVVDIRGNIGLSYGVELVMTMLYFLMSLVDKNSRQFDSNLLKTIKEWYKKSSYWKPFNNLYKSLNKDKKNIKYNFIPHPVSAKELANGYIPWQELTRNYEGGAVLEIINLWKNQDDKVTLANMILASVNFKTPKQQILYLDQVKTVLKEHVFEKENQSSESSEQENRLKELDSKVLVLERVKTALQNKVNEQEAENGKLKALLEEKKQDGAARKFTLVEMVNYCKSSLTSDEAKEIIIMLNKLLRNVGTSEDYDLLDRTEKELKNKKYGDTVSGNKNSLGDYSTVINFLLSPNTDYAKVLANLPDEIKEILRKQLTQKNNG